jgi:hypothetical protein
MSLQNDFLPLAVGGGSNVQTLAAYEAEATRLTGFQAGTAPSAVVNRAVRQATTIAAMIGQFIADYSGEPALDDGNISELEANFVGGLLGALGNSALHWGVDVGTTNNISFTTSATLTELEAGVVVLFKAAHANTGATGLTANGIGPYPLTTTALGSLPLNTITVGGIYAAAWDGTEWQLITGGAAGGSSSNAPSGTLLQLNAGSAAISSGDLVEIGGPGSHCYSAQTTDYAAVPTAGVIVPPASFVGNATTGMSKQQIERDGEGNIFMLGVNASGCLTVFKQSPVGARLGSVVLDTDTTGVFTPLLLKLSNGAFAAVYARASGGLYQVVFDSGMNLVNIPTAIVDEKSSTNTVYHAACALAAGGFAVVYQSFNALSVNVQVLNNAGVQTLSETLVQTMSGTPSIVWLSVKQLSNSNLVVAIRGAMTPVGTSFNIITTGGASVVSNTVVDATSGVGFLSVDVMTSYFAIATANGAHLIAGVYSNAGVLQGSPFSVVNTLNYTTYRQMHLINDGAQFWLTWIGSANAGVNVTQLPIAGSGYLTVTALCAQTITSTYALDTALINGLLVCFCASTTTAGQYWLAIGLPDASIGAAQPYLVTAAQALGVGAQTTGCSFPRIISGGDFTAIFAYEQSNAAATFYAVQKLMPTAIVGVSQSTVGANTTNSLVSVYAPIDGGSSPINTLLGTGGLTFNHNMAEPSGAAGQLYSSGVTMVAFGNYNAAMYGAGAPIQLPCNPSKQINQNDIVTLGDDGYAYSGSVSDYIKAANANTQIVTVTAVTYPLNYAYFASNRQSVVTPNKQILKLGAYTATLGIVLYRYSAQGTFIGSLNLDTATNYSYIGDPKMLLLSNGNIVISYVNLNNSYLYYGIVDPYGTRIVQAFTPIEYVYASSPCQHSIVVNPLGGWMLCWQAQTTGYARMAYFDDVGVITVNPFTHKAWSGTPARVYHASCHLSNGYIATVFFNYFGGGAGGLYYSISSWTGAVIVAPTLITTNNMLIDTALAGHEPTIKAGDGCFAIAAYNNYAGQKNYTLWSITNYGVLTGYWADAYSASNVNYFIAPRVEWDGQNFWLCHASFGGSASYLSKFVRIPPRITGYQLFNGYPLPNNVALYHHHTFFENGRIVCGYQGGAYALCHSVFNCFTGLMEFVGLSLSATAGYWPRLIAGGDFTVVRHWSYTTVTYDVITYANAALIGVAQTTAAPGSLVTVSQSGTFRCNALKGDASIIFDHSNSNIYGNLGAMFNNSVILKGMGGKTA